ncbi:hypothetical protein C0989_010009 [Termitomyces sp. Mn162]|nr:hypothetical protein C0989_010009 [Termitomyces sp. Mn162]
MSQLANPDTLSEALALQNKAWTHLLHLETQVQLMQSSLTHHTTKLSTLHQTTDLISQLLQALLKHLTPTPTPPPAVEPALTTSALIFIALVTLWLWIPCSVLPDAYNGAHSSREHFLQSCLIYIHLSRDAFNCDMLKIAWVLLYMKIGYASTYALQVFHHPRGVGSFLDQTTFKKDFCTEFFLLDPAKTVALTLRNREQYEQEKQMLEEYINLFWALVEQATYPNGLQLCLTFWDGLHPMLVEHIDNLAEGHSDDKKIAS